jgi:hypothetical protein
MASKRSNIAHDTHAGGFRHVDFVPNKNRTRLPASSHSLHGSRTCCCTSNPPKVFATATKGNTFFTCIDCIPTCTPHGMHQTTQADVALIGLPKRRAQHMRCCRCSLQPSLLAATSYPNAGMVHWATRSSTWLDKFGAHQCALEVFNH